MLLNHQKVHSAPFNSKTALFSAVKGSDGTFSEQKIEFKGFNLNTLYIIYHMHMTETIKQMKKKKVLYSNTDRGFRSTRGFNSAWGLKAPLPFPYKN